MPICQHCAFFKRRSSVAGICWYHGCRVAPGETCDRWTPKVIK